MKNKIALSAVVTMLSAACAPTESSAPPSAMETPAPTPTTGPGPSETAVALEPISVAYAHADPRQTLDVYLPPNAEGPFPTILAIHGGAFRARSKELYREIGPRFARNGYAFAAINYRFLPTYSFPAQVEDAFCALAWLHARQETFGFDPGRVVVLGGSAGGYLASMLATVDDPGTYLASCPHPDPGRPATHAAVIFYGFYDFTTIDDYPDSQVPLLAEFWGAPHDEIAAAQLRAMSPIAQIDGSEPPFILLHGTADTLIPSVMSERFADALSAAGVDAELVLLPGVNHAFELEPLDGPEMSLSLDEIDAFLDRVLPPRGVGSQARLRAA